jgi:pimeloyl-ACP methyl ester carboxylesterase
VTTALRATTVAGVDVRVRGAGEPVPAAESTATARRAAITLPVLLLQGADTWSPVPEGVDALACALPHAERVMWEGQSHFAVAGAPSLVAGAVRDFVGRHR